MAFQEERRMNRILLILITMTSFNHNILSQVHQHSTSENGKIRSVVFNGFPVHDEDYAYDLIPLLHEIIERHGPEEWRLAVITSELHGHLGIYSIIGTKMGLKAKELLDAGHGEISVVTLAGRKPPLSCMIDGLQVSTGATAGHGLLQVSEDHEVIPAATFEANGRKITLVLKEGIYHRIREVLEHSRISNHGLTDGYWEEVRQLAIEYWLSLDRHDIFETR